MQKIYFKVQYSILYLKNLVKIVKKKLIVNAHLFANCHFYILINLKQLLCSRDFLEK